MGRRLNYSNLWIPPYKDPMSWTWSKNAQGKAAIRLMHLFQTFSRFSRLIKVKHNNNLCYFRTIWCKRDVWTVHRENMVWGWETKLQVHHLWKASFSEDQSEEPHWKCSLSGTLQLQLQPLWKKHSRVKMHFATMCPSITGSETKSCDMSFQTE